MGEQMIDMKTMGQRLRDLRTEAGKTASEVSMATGIGESALRNYECGLRIPRFKAMFKLAEYYGKTVDFIFFR